MDKARKKKYLWKYEKSDSDIINKNKIYDLFPSLVALTLLIYFKIYFLAAAVVIFTAAVFFLKDSKSKWINIIREIIQKVAYFLGNSIINTLLIIVYLTVITPVSMVCKIFRIDPLKLNTNKNEKTFWLSINNAGTKAILKKPFALEDNIRAQSNFTKILSISSKLSCNIFVVFLIIELTLRLVWLNPYGGTKPDKILKLPIHHANLALNIDRSGIHPAPKNVKFNVDSNSFIMPSVMHEDPEYKIAFLGGSTTECIVVQEDLRFPEIVRKELESNLDKKINIYNAARSGGTLHDSINILINHINKFEPDMLIVMHAVNDRGVIQRDNYYSRMGEHVSAKNIIKYVLQIGSSSSYGLGFIRKFQAQLTLVQPDVNNIRENRNINYNPTDTKSFEMRLKALIGISKAYNIELVVMTQPFLGNISNKLTPEWADNEEQNLFNTKIVELCLDNNVNLIDLDKHIKQIVSKSDLGNSLYYDGLHVTDKGSKIYGEYISKHLTKLLSEK